MGKRKSSRKGAAHPRRLSRRRILEAARAHFFQHGFRNVTMDDLATELGASKKTLYAHFASKDALLEAVLQDKLKRVDAALTRARRGAHEFPIALRNLLSELQRELDEISPPFLRDMRKAPEAFHRLEERRPRLIREHFGRLFRHGQRAGNVRSDLPTALMIETLLAFVQAIMNPQKLKELGLAPREAFAHLIDLLLYGALIREGGKR